MYRLKLKKLLQTKSKDQIVYVDESGFEKRDQYQRSAWSKRGQTIYGTRSGNRSKRESLLLAKRDKQHFSPMIFQGTCNAEIFNTWLEHVLIPCLNHGDVVVMDNAAFHKSKKTKELIEAAGCELLFLPPYSPDYNPIENSFGSMKTIWRNNPEMTLDEVVGEFI